MQSNHKVARMIRLVILIPLAWAVGVWAYLAALDLIWGQTVGSDLDAVLFWSALAFLVAVPTAYIPTLFGLRRLLGGYRPVIVFPIATALLGVLPTALIVFVWGGGFGSLVSPTTEVVLFYILFVSAGVVLGVGFAWPRRVTS